MSTATVTALPRHRSVQPAWRPWMFAVGTGVLALVAASAFQLGRGPAPVGLGDIWSWLQGSTDVATAAVIEGARLPRWEAGLLAGGALGAAGVLFQATTRNPLADPGLLGVGAGAQLAVVVVAVTGWNTAGLPRGGAALIGGLAAAGLVFLIGAGGGTGPARLVLAGSAVALLCSSAAAVVTLLHEQRTAGLFFWGQGTLAQLGTDRLRTALPLVVAGGVAAALVARPVDLLALGDDRASALGLSAARLRLLTIAVGVVLTAAAVTVTGPIGFVGLLSPHLVRRLGAVRTGPMLVASALWGAGIVLVADGIVRGIGNASTGGELPAGVITALVGAPFLIVVARRAAGGVPPRDANRVPRLPLPGALVLGLVAATSIVVLVGALMLGDQPVPLSAVLSSLVGGSDAATRSLIIDGRLPRTLVAAAAGAALAISGTLLQGATRNSLAAPATMGIVGGASLGALSVAFLLPGAPAELIPVAAFAGGTGAVGLVVAVAGRLDPTRLVLVGVAAAAFAAALVDILVVANQVRLAQALTWLAGSTYGRDWPDLLLILPGFVLALAGAWFAGRHADVLRLGDDRAASVGIRVGWVRGLLLGLATLAAASAVAVVGAIGFAGLIAPHTARLLVGSRTRLVLPASALVGAVLLVVADSVGRSVAAPRELPSGLLVAVIGAPVFVALLWRTRSSTA